MNERHITLAHRVSARPVSDSAATRPFSQLLWAHLLIFDIRALWQAERQSERMSEIKNVHFVSKKFPPLNPL